MRRFVVKQAMMRAPFLLALIGASGCGQRVSTATNREDSLGGHDEPGASGEPEGGADTESATVSGMSCAELTEAGMTAYVEKLSQGTQCEVASDCSRRFELPPGGCWGRCSYVESGTPSWQSKIGQAMAAAQEFCEEFRSKGCEIQPPSCPPNASKPTELVVACVEGVCRVE